MILRSPFLFFSFLFFFFFEFVSGVLSCFSMVHVCVPSDVLLGFMHLKKKQPPLVVSYRETSSSICSFIDSGGPLKPLGGMPLLGLRVRFTNQRVADSFSGAHDLPLVSVCSTAGSLVLQQQVTPLSFFLISPQASKVY